MGWIDIYNKAFPEPKPKKKKKLKDWTPNPKYFENESTKKIKEQSAIKIRLEIDRLKKEKYIKLPNESKEEKIKRENRLEVKIQKLEKQLQSGEVDHPLSKLQSRINKSLENDSKNQSGMLITDSESNFEKSRNYRFAIERLIYMRYLYSLPKKNISLSEKENENKIRADQIASLKPWLDYFKYLPSNSQSIKFSYFFIGCILKYDLYWMEKNEDGTWKTGERSKGTKKVFPIFDPDLSPQIISKMRELMAYLNIEDFIHLAKMVGHAEPELADEHPFRQALERGDFREMYSILYDSFSLSRIEEKDVLETKHIGWQDVYTISEIKEDSQEKENEKNYEVAKKLSKATEFSRGFCLKSPSTALDYLKQGDVYLYIVEKTVKVKTGEIKKVRVPEIAIHVENDGNINPKEIHGNAPNQGIRVEFLPIARKWVAESDFKNKDEFEVKFADAEMFAIIGDKLNNLEKLGENGVLIVPGDENDLNARELKFLYEIYRKPTSFEISIDYNKISGLRGKRYNIFMFFYKDFNAVKMRNRDYATIFNCKPDEVYCDDPYRVKDDIPENIKVFVGDVDDLTVFGIDQDKLDSIEVVVGNTSSRILEDLKNVREVTRKIIFHGSIPPKKIPKYFHKVCGVEVNDLDRPLLTKTSFDSSKKEFPLQEFPIWNDPRLKKVFY